MSTTTGPSRAIETATIDESSLLAFYRDMNLPERRTFWACAAGWALDGMDFMIYPLVIGTIIALWKVDPGLAGLAGTVTLLSSAVGGWLGGYISDRIGRVRTLQFTILWFSFFSLVCAVAQNFDQLLLAPAVLGLGFRRGRRCRRSCCFICAATSSSPTSPRKPGPSRSRAATSRRCGRYSRGRS